MDLITQGLAGALLAQSAARRKDSRAALLVGIVAGILPDADILIRSAEDPLLNLEFHRQFTHALIFIPIGALISAVILWPLLRKRLGFCLLYGLCLCGYATGGLLDACTSFGTGLLWPFSDQRIAWNLVSVVDPLFTLGLLAAVVAGWFYPARRYVLLGILFAVSYLGMAWHQQQAVLSVQQELAQARGHERGRFLVKPTLGNILLWRSIYLADGRYHVDAIRMGLTGASRVYPGGSVAEFVSGKNLPSLPRDSLQFHDIERFRYLSQGYLVQHPKHPDVIADIRFAMLPDSIDPLWGIRVNAARADQHVTEALFRRWDTGYRRRFIDMVLGRDSTPLEN